MARLKATWSVVLRMSGGSSFQCCGPAKKLVLKTQFWYLECCIRYRLLPQACSVVRVTITARRLPGYLPDTGSTLQRAIWHSLNLILFSIGSQYIFIIFPIIWSLRPRPVCRRTAAWRTRLQWRVPATMMRGRPAVRCSSQVWTSQMLT